MLNSSSGWSTDSVLTCQSNLRNNIWICPQTNLITCITFKGSNWLCSLYCSCPRFPCRKITSVSLTQNWFLRPAHTDTTCRMNSPHPNFSPAGWSCLSLTILYNDLYTFGFLLELNRIKGPSGFTITLTPDTCWTQLHLITGSLVWLLVPPGHWHVTRRNQCPRSKQWWGLLLL